MLRPQLSPWAPVRTLGWREMTNEIVYGLSANMPYIVHFPASSASSPDFSYFLTFSKVFANRDVYLYKTEFDVFSKIDVKGVYLLRMDRVFYHTCLSLYAFVFVYSISQIKIWVTIDGTSHPPKFFTALKQSTKNEKIRRQNPVKWVTQRHNFHWLIHVWDLLLCYLFQWNK